jgi:hypothetical protein
MIKFFKLPHKRARKLGIGEKQQRLHCKSIPSSPEGFFLSLTYLNAIYKKKVVR